MSRKVFIELKVALTINMEEGLEITEVLENMDYNFNSTHSKAEIENEEILDWSVENSK